MTAQGESALPPPLMRPEAGRDRRCIHLGEISPPEAPTPSRRDASEGAADDPRRPSRAAAEICRLAPVIPVLVIEDVAHGRPLAEALVSGRPARAGGDAAHAGGAGCDPGDGRGAGRSRRGGHAADARGCEGGQGGGREVRRLARGNRPADRGLRGRGAAAAARGRDRDRGDVAAGKGLYRPEVLSGRGQRRGARAEGDRRSRSRR